MSHWGAEKDKQKTEEPRWLSGQAEGRAGTEARGLTGNQRNASENRMRHPLTPLGLAKLAGTVMPGVGGFCRQGSLYPANGKVESGVTLGNHLAVQGRVTQRRAPGASNSTPQRTPELSKMPRRVSHTFQNVLTYICQRKKNSGSEGILFLNMGRGSGYNDKVMRVRKPMG